MRSQQQKNPRTSRTPDMAQNNPYSALAGENEVSGSMSEDIGESVNEAIKVAMAAMAIETDKSKQISNGGKKNKNGKDKTQPATTAAAAADTGQPVSGTTLDIGTLVQQIMQAMTPLVTAAVTTAVSAAMKAVLGTVVQQAVAQVERKMNEKMEANSLLFKYDIDRMEQYSRRESIRISGLPEPAEESEEKLRDSIVELGAAIGVNLQPTTISVCHRLGRRVAGKRRPVICKFVARTSKIALLSSKKNLKGKEEYKGIYINEDLTRIRSKLFHKARQDDKVKNATTKDGKVICYMKEGIHPSPVVLETPDDLFKLGFDDVVYKDFGLDDFTQKTWDE